MSEDRPEYIVSQAHTATRTRFTATELAALRLPGMPQTPHGIRHCAQREQWPAEASQGKGGRGGKHINYTVPPYVLALISGATTVPDRVLKRPGRPPNFQMSNDGARCMGRAIEHVAVPMPYPECEACLRRISPGNPHLQSWQKPHDGPGPCPMRLPLNPSQPGAA